ncbi:glycosyltransferase family 4 protein [Thermodesulfobacteriota bacterium B35]
MNKHILYLHRTQGRGAEGSHIRGMVDGFREQGWIVDIVGPPGVDPYRFQTDQESKTSFLGRLLRWFAERAPQVCFELVEVLYNSVALSRLRKQWKHGKGYDFIYERYALNSFAGALFASAHKVPLVLEVNDATVIERSRPLVMKRLARRIERKVLYRAHLVITITEQFKKLLIEHHDIPSSRIMVLPNAIDPKKYILQKEKRFQRSKLAIPEDSIVLGCVGAFVQWHGLEFLLETMAPDARKLNLFFFFIGDGPVRQKVETKATVYGVEDRLRFSGFVAHDLVPYYLDLVDICVIPQSNAHCSPMKLFEYLAAGKPVVLPAYQPLLDVVTGDQEGLFFEPGNREELRQVLLKAIRSPELCKLLGSQGRDQVGKRFTWQNNAISVTEKISLMNE